MTTSSYLVQTLLHCDACGHTLQKNLRDVARLDLMHCPKCSKSLNLAAGPNATSIACSMAEMAADRTR